MAWIPEAFQDLLSDETRAFGWLATLMKDGSPQLSIIWFNTDGKHILINSTKTRLKTWNMKRDPRVAFVITDPKNSYRYIRIRGKVVEITTRGAREHIDALAKKYRGTDKYTSGSADEERVIFKILPEKIGIYPSK